VYEAKRLGLIERRARTARRYVAGSFVSDALASLPVECLSRFKGPVNPTAYLLLLWVPQLPRAQFAVDLSGHRLLSSMC
jgi:hypothetical protein